MRRLCCFLVLFCFAACSDSAGKRRIVVGFSQCNGEEPWRVLFDKEIKARAEELGVELLYSDAQNDVDQQRAHIGTFVQKEVDALLVSPKDAKTQTAAIEAAMDQGIPVFVLDRGVDSKKYSCYVGGDNYAIGRAAGEHAVKLLGGKGKVIEIWGGKTSTPAQNRSKGFHDAIRRHHSIEIIVEQEANWNRDEARRVMQSLLKAHEEIDLVYGHNDPMAIGAWLAAKEAGREKDMLFFGIDGNPGAVGGCQAVLDGKLAATFLYPTPGGRALELCVAMLRDGVAPPRDLKLPTVTITKENAAEYAGK